MDESAHGDSSWEYNAPQFVDFAAHHSEDDDVDAWFDIDHENEGIEEEYTAHGTPVLQDVDVIEDADVEIQKQAETPQSERRLTRSMLGTPNNEKQLSQAPESIKDPKKKEVFHSAPSTPDEIINNKDQSNTSSAASAGKNKPKVAVNNICTSLGEWRSKTSKPKQTPENNPRPTRQTGKQEVVTKSTMVKREHRSLESSNRTAMANKKQNVSVSNVKSNPAADRSARLQRRSTETTRKSRRTSSVGALDTKTIAQTARSNLKRTNSVGRMNTSVGRANTSAGKINMSMNNRRSHSRVNSVERPQRGRLNSTSSDTKEDTGPASKVPRMTIPTTPTCLKRKPTIKSSIKPTAEMEIDQIAYLRSELAKKRKMAQESYKKAVTATSYVPVHSVKEPTMPQEFHFQTDTRIKSHGMETRNDCKEKDFVATLRHTERAKSPAPANRITVPQPFHLTEYRKRKMSNTESESDSKKFTSMAERLTAFHSKTPDRFKSKPKGQPTENARTRRSRSPGVTVPKTPNLETRGRSRPVHIPSREEMEEKELEEIKQHQFKAHPVNQKILTNPNTGVRKVPTKPLTEVEEFNFESNKRLHNMDRHLNEEEKFEFHAQPVPKKILEGVVGVKPIKEGKVTIPQSPAFALKHRARIPVEVPEEKEEKEIVRSNPVPHVGIPFQPKLSHKYTVPEPFGFEERNKYLRAKKEERIQEVLQEEQKVKSKHAREFHAQPLPSSSPEMLPQKNPKRVTIPEPFALEADQRGARKAAEWNRKMEEELRQQRSQSKFKASRSDVLHKDPFIPAKSIKPLTELDEFSLNTDRRAIQREGFEMNKKAKEAEIESLKRQVEHRQEEEEKAAIARLRMEMIHKSNPIKKFRSVEIQPSDKPLTAANSPKFLTDSRLRSKVRV